MKNNIIKIPSVDYNKITVSEDILYSLGKIANDYRFNLKDNNNHLESLIKEYQNNVNESLKELDSRKNTWKKLLGKYYKMTYEKDIQGYTYKNVSYIFPYKVIDENNTLWLLEVKEGDNYDGGVKDENRTIDNNWNYDIYLEEITEDEFRNKAFEATKHVIDRRLKKLSEPNPQYMIIDNT